MTRRRRPAALVGLACASALLASSGPAHGDARPERSRVISIDGLRLVSSVRFEGGSEIAADGRFVYANQLDGTTARGQHPDRGGLRILSHRRGDVHEVGTLTCPGNDNDVQPVRRGLVVMAHHSNRCNGGHGLLMIDVRAPREPRVIGRLALPSGASAHTVTPHPHLPYVYVSPGGMANGGGEELVVDVSDARRPRLVATFLPGRVGCHDLSMLERADSIYGLCAGLGETSIWDLSDPLAPVIVGRILNPATEFMYVAQPSPDGELLAIVDEAFVAHDCTGGSGPGGVWLYDIGDITAPRLVGRIAPPASRGAAPLGRIDDIQTWCAAHGIAWHPRHRDVLAVTWYSAGVGVYDVTSPASPTELASFRAADSLAEAVVWHDGLLFSNDLRRGVDVFELTERASQDATREPGAQRSGSGHLERAAVFTRRRHEEVGEV